MSDVMTKAVIGMPYEMAMGGEMSRRQFYARAQALLAERNSLAHLLKRFVDGEHVERHMYHDEAEAILAYLGGEVQGHTLVPDEILRKQYEQRMALIAENELLTTACARAETIINTESKAAAFATARANLLQAENERHVEDYDKAWRHDLNDKNNYQVLVAEVARLRANAGRYQFIADNACDVSFYVANTDSGDGDTKPGPRVELTPDQYPVEMFGSGKAKLDFAVDALIAARDVSTPSTDTEDVSRHEI